ncbi:MAG TPA: helix-turn-helix domain-containing protein [Phycisphaerae bacterium]|nr:helix-turn-helix domain-containing protein [Phycisphaerae bacterium]
MKSTAPSSSAPALTRGIAVLRLLGDARARTLEEIARATRWPKSSLLRLCRDLTALGLLGRDEASRAYTARARIVPLHTGGELSGELDAALERLVEATGRTAEWYVPSETGMVIVRRAEPQTAEVRVIARVGFVRAWRGELDAVAALGAAWFRPREHSTAGYWTYVRPGVRGALPVRSAAGKIARARETGFVADEVVNPHSVRRQAGVVIREGRPLGVLALAEHVGPRGRASAPAVRAALENEIRKLSDGGGSAPRGTTVREDRS